MKTIRIYVNGKYEFTTRKHNTIKSAIASLREKKTVTIASIPNRVLTISDSDKITGKIV